MPPARRTCGAPDFVALVSPRRPGATIAAAMKAQRAAVVASAARGGGQAIGHRHAQQREDARVRHSGQARDAAPEGLADRGEEADRGSPRYMKDERDTRGGWETFAGTRAERNVVKLDFHYTRVW